MCNVQAYGLSRAAVCLAQTACAGLRIVKSPEPARGTDRPGLCFTTISFCFQLAGEVAASSRAGGQRGHFPSFPPVFVLCLPWEKAAPQFAPSILAPLLNLGHSALAQLTLGGSPVTLEVCPGAGTSALADLHTCMCHSESPLLLTNARVNVAEWEARILVARGSAGSV